MRDVTSGSPVVNSWVGCHDAPSSLPLLAAAIVQESLDAVVEILPHKLGWVSELCNGS